jgi:hypothetical protein
MYTAAVAMRQDVLFCPAVCKRRILGAEVVFE